MTRGRAARVPPPLPAAVSRCNSSKEEVANMVFRTEAACDGKEMRSNSSTLSMRRIASWLEPQKIILDAELRDRRHALESAATEIGRMHGLDPEPILRALWRRELIGSTALGSGVA